MMTSRENDSIYATSKSLHKSTYNTHNRCTTVAFPDAQFTALNFSLDLSVCSSKPSAISHFGQFGACSYVSDFNPPDPLIRGLISAMYE